MLNRLGLNGGIITVNNKKYKIYQSVLDYIFYCLNDWYIDYEKIDYIDSINIDME